MSIFAFVIRPDTAPASNDDLERELEIETAKARIKNNVEQQQKSKLFVVLKLIAKNLHFHLADLCRKH